jgi:two-component system OmpR family response regulator
MMNVLLVEDDPVLGRGLQVNLELDGYKVFWASSLKEAEQLNRQEKIALVILDIGLPDGSGFDFVTHVRAEGSRLPIIILTAKTDEDSVVHGLQLGANDYMKKPFGNRELMARIKAILREPQTRERQIRFADLVILIEQRSVQMGDKVIDLNRREFDILLHLIERADTIVSRESLLQFLDKEGEIFDRTIDSHISHLRSRLKKAGALSVKISSVYGLGYRLEKA